LNCCANAAASGACAKRAFAAADAAPGRKVKTSVTPDQVKAIQDSFKLVAPISDQAAAIFYGRLFEIAPAVKPLFRGDMTEQGRKLMATLGVVVNSLGNLEAVLPAASALAKRHVDYGVKAEDYTPVGAALLWTLQQGSANIGRRSSRRRGAPPSRCCPAT
jgi:hemoglobin-like flavoprotein